MSERLPADDVIGPDERDPGPERELADFTTGTRLLRLVPLAALVGVFGAGVALALLKLIALFTNLAYYHSFSTDPRGPAGHDLGVLALVVALLVALPIDAHVHMRRVGRVGLGLGAASAVTDGQRRQPSAPASPIGFGRGRLLPLRQARRPSRTGGCAIVLLFGADKPAARRPQLRLLASRISCRGRRLWIGGWPRTT